LARPLSRILIKNLPEDLLRELKRLKVELDCRIWAELLEKLVESRKKEEKGEGEGDPFDRGGIE